MTIKKDADIRERRRQNLGKKGNNEGGGTGNKPVGKKKEKDMTGRVTYGKLS